MSAAIKTYTYKNTWPGLRSGGGTINGGIIQSNKFLTISSHSKDKNGEKKID